MKIQGAMRYLSLAILGVGAFVLGGSQSASAVAASTCTWNGGTDTKFSTAANWSCDTGTLPVANSAIIIDVKDGASTQLSLTNDLGLTLDSIAVKNTGTAYGSATIDTLTLADGGTYSGNASTNPGGSVSVTTVNATNMTLLGGYASQFVVSGVLTLSSNVYLNLYPTAASSINAIVVQNGASLALNASAAGDNTFATDLTFGGGSSTASPRLTAYGKSEYVNKEWVASATKDILSGTVTLNTNVTVLVDNVLTTLSVVKATAGTAKFVYDPLSQGPLIVAGVEMPYVVKTTDLVCNSTNYYSFTVAKNETATIAANAACQSGYVNVDGVLKGNGSIVHATGNTWGGYLTIGEGGTIAPGMSPGCITTDNFSLWGTYQFEVGGTDPCTGYDQVIVTSFYDSEVAPYNTVELGVNSELQTSVYGGFAPAKGQSYTIINNQSKWPVGGTFKGLPEGTSFTSNGIVYQISYAAGDGNDVVLTVLDAPLVPNTGVAITKANPAVIAIATVVLASALALVGRTALARR